MRAGAVPRLVGLAGPELLRPEEHLLTELGPDGVVLFPRNVRDAQQVQALCAHVQEILGREAPAIVAADHEGGAVSVLRAAIGTPPSALTLGVAGDEALTRRVHAATGRLCRALGVQVLLAPVADVVEGSNPVLGPRSFGRQPGPVVDQVMAAVAGFHDAGVLACAKHWPGHGRARQDTHLEPARIEAPRSDLAAVDLPPFLAAIQAGVDLIMVGHLQVDALDPGGHLAPCSPAMLQALRATAAFDGVIVTDALEMVGFDRPDIDAFVAGCDLLLYASPLGDLADRLHQLDRAERDVSPSRGREARARVDALRRRLPGPGGGSLETPSVYDEARRAGVAVLWPEHRGAAAWPPLGAAQTSRWGLVDLASGDRLLRDDPRDLTPRADAVSQLRSSLERALGSSAVAVATEPVAPGPDGALDGVVLATLRPLAETEAGALLRGLLDRGVGWLALLGDSGSAAWIPGDLGVIIVPGVEDADVEVLAGLLTGRLARNPDPRWGD